MNRKNGNGYCIDVYRLVDILMDRLIQYHHLWLLTISFLLVQKMNEYLKKIDWFVQK